MERIGDVFIGICLVLSGLIVGAAIGATHFRQQDSVGQQEPQQPEPWVIYDEMWGQERDMQGLRSYLLEATDCGVSWEESTITVYLDYEEGSKPRSELLKIAEDAAANLPDGCPFVVEIETLEEAIASEHRQIKEHEQNIKNLAQIHGEQPPPRACNEGCPVLPKWNQ